MTRRKRNAVADLLAKWKELDSTVQPGPYNDIADLMCFLAKLSPKLLRVVEAAMEVNKNYEGEQGFSPDSQSLSDALKALGEE